MQFVETDDMMVIVKDITNIRCDTERCIVDYAGLQSTCTTIS